MAYPLIILGAGASHDFSSLGKLAPLTNHLVDDQFLDHELLEQFPGAGDLLNDVIHQVRTGNRGFEEVLTEMKARAKDIIPIHGQFVAMVFYLKGLFERISTRPRHVPHEVFSRMRTINNYRSLVNRLISHTGGRAIVTTFNYDSLFEKSILNKTFGSMRDYVNGDLKVVKLHGSHDWTYIRRRQSQELGNDWSTTTGFEWCVRNPQAFDTHREKTDAQLMHEIEFQRCSEKDEFFSLPALAIPIIDKDRYMCPLDHIGQLQLELPKIDRILVIGWKAGDSLLLKHLHDLLLKNAYKILVVSGTLKEAEEIAGTFRDKLDASPMCIQAYGGGFSGFIKDEISNTFFTG